MIYKVMLMLYTISDFSREYEGSVRLIAGSDGVSRAVSGVGILDYELMPGLKNKYQRVNFSPDEIVLSTFLYAKDDPYLITEAVNISSPKERAVSSSKTSCTSRFPTKPSATPTRGTTRSFSRPTTHCSLIASSMRSNGISSSSRPSTSHSARSMP